ncbi:hypothetical protein AG1IA_08869 [Rhizoctonia solani AG-1 IA]|uniref:Uncharacterized protein n=1 Tax=Thanatephorus cucumeris (strain AG1-IA) TaxID=983506 RepID=L8WJW1_THACA|nr:hypothetical protein AG1IA_08869 [Rhizoctonia solani AG-1 IA]
MVNGNVVELTKLHRAWSPVFGLNRTRSSPKFGFPWHQKPHSICEVPAKPDQYFHGSTPTPRPYMPLSCRFSVYGCICLGRTDVTRILCTLEFPVE